MGWLIDFAFGWVADGVIERMTRRKRIWIAGGILLLTVLVIAVVLRFSSS